MEFNLGKEVGATEEPAAQRLTLYIPNKDRDDAVIGDHQAWCVRGQELLTEIGAGATSFPPVDGTWRKPDGSDLWERTVIIYTFVDPDKLVAKVQELRLFLHQFGAETNQGKVVFEFDGWLWSIDTYDPARE